MSKFLTSTALHDVIYDIIWDAEQTLLIVSPFIKLDDYFKEIFTKHKNNPKLHIVIVFGKNETERSKSLNSNDFTFFKEFSNISIIYVPTLHAKYYGNERKGVITSINLYDYSFKNNIEFGVFHEQGFLNNLSTKADQEAWNFCMDMAYEGEAVFIKRPVYEKKKFVVNLGKNYVKSDVLLDQTDTLNKTLLRNKKEYRIAKLDEFPDEITLGSEKSERPRRETFAETPNSATTNNHTGYCIRTGTEIPFNPEQPFSYMAWKTWAQFENYDFAESYCHRTGKESFGKTSMRNPILNDNYKNYG
ncbi:MAG: hypothetical protein CL605_09440 [Altibacter sp.]|uniref:phospholipase D family protein n=1 Tax=Altibacter sp. TaxID=2024823 RepID=UPI000C9057A2|nr:phospholipase D family protein [Altibacter sp.]MAP55112.1 hypothetical protein [Altibacter sp.]|tara:strand:+ start:37 stop:945 length:909 start_codon:yes stop_codon:yes gene_type:complete